MSKSRRKSSALGLRPAVWFFVGQLGESQPIRQLTLHNLPCRVGRLSDIGLSLPCHSVSKEHAEIYLRDDDELWVKDLHSTNGTYVNGIPVQYESVLREGDIVQFATMVFRVGREPCPSDGATAQEDAAEYAQCLLHFEKLLYENAVVPFFQPIIDLHQRQPIGYEVLGRSRLFGLHMPREMFQMASQLGLEAELSQAFRDKGVGVGDDVFDTNLALFVNTHPVEVASDGLFQSLRALRQCHPDRSITIEIHEAAVTDADVIAKLRSILVELDMQLAFDDFGKGKARLIELSDIRPEYLKFDMKFARDIHLAPASRQEFVARLVALVNDLGINSLVEGVESEEEHETLLQMGFALGQGYHYGVPAAIGAYGDVATDAFPTQPAPVSSQQ